MPCIMEAGGRRGTGVVMKGHGSTMKRHSSRLQLHALLQISGTGSTMHNTAQEH